MDTEHRPAGQAYAALTDAEAAILGTIKKFHTHDFGRGPELHADAITDAYKRGRAAVAQAGAQQMTALRSEIEQIIEHSSIPGPELERGTWCCTGCGSWTPHNHPEAHEHEEGCPALAEWQRKSDWRARLRTLLADRSTDN